ncbi:MAG: hypothetical protein IK032_09185 [Bacteroidales bacterium]|nr:hypothetical protein [Bacteroidales bacterium]
MDKICIKKHHLNLCLRILAGISFIASAVLKYLTVDSFDMYIYEHQLFGYVATETLTRCLIAAEFCLGVFMIAGIFLRFTKYTMLVFLVAFTAYLLLQPYLFDVDGENCHCFGDFFSLGRWQSVLKNIVLIALAIPINPALPWHFRWPKTGFVAMAVLSLAAVFSLITPSYIDQALYGKEVTIDGSLFRTTMLETGGGEALLQGRKVVCFYSTSCGYCRKAAKKVHIAMGNAHIDDNDVQIVFWHTNPEKPVEEFFEKSGVPPLQYVEIPTATFLDITQGSMPVIAFVDNGDVKECHKYIELNERQMSNFLSKKQ